MSSDKEAEAEALAYLRSLKRAGKTPERLKATERTAGTSEIDVWRSWWDQRLPLSPPSPFRDAPFRPPLSRTGVLTSSRNGSVSETFPVATHWKEAFCPALTSTSPSREK